MGSPMAGFWNFGNERSFQLVSNNRSHWRFFCYISNFRTILRQHILQHRSSVLRRNSPNGMNFFVSDQFKITYLKILKQVVRAQGVAFIHIMGYVASIISPFVVYLSHISLELPLIVLGVLSIFGGCLSLLLPETLNHELPQTLADGEEFGRGQSMFDFPCCAKSVDDDKDEEIGKFKRSFSSSGQASLRASTRGEYSSSILQRSVRSRSSFKSVNTKL